MGLFGAVRDKLARKSSGSSTSKRVPSWTSSLRSGTMMSSNAGGDGQLPQQQQQRGSTSTNTINPFATTAPPTRRPGMSDVIFHEEQRLQLKLTPLFTAARDIPLGNSDDLPPAYSPAAPAAAAPASANVDDRFNFLATFDTIFLIDDSGSMAGRSWRETEAALRTITPVCTAYDADGIDIYFLNHVRDEARYRNITSPEAVARIFQTVRPSGGTPTGIRLHQILKPYLERYAAQPATTKPLNIIVITDGVPTDDVESVIISAARKLDRLDAPAWQCGIQFFQVGNAQEAAQSLAELDDGLADGAGAGGLRDMVDTVPWREDAAGLDGELILKVVLGAVNRRLDRKKAP